jgi:hypothetical protein
VILLICAVPENSRSHILPDDSSFSGQYIIILMIIQKSPCSQLRKSGWGERGFLKVKERLSNKDNMCEYLGAIGNKKQYILCITHK